MGMPKGVKLNLPSLRDRRLAARSLLDEGLSQAEVARRLKVSRQSVSRWARQPRRTLSRVKQQGRKSRFSQATQERLIATLAAGPQAAGFPSPLWTAPEAQQLLAREFNLHYSSVHVWRLLRRLKYNNTNS